LGDAAIVQITVIPGLSRKVVARPRGGLRLFRVLGSTDSYATRRESGRRLTSMHDGIASQQRLTIGHDKQGLQHHVYIAAVARRCLPIWQTTQPSDPIHCRSLGASFPSWFMRVVCDRCGKVRMINETHTPQRAMLIRDIIAKMRHDGCGGRAGKVELITGIEAVSRCCLPAARPITCVLDPSPGQALEPPAKPLPHTGALC
jgi:hypothetical protein